MVGLPSESNMIDAKNDAFFPSDRSNICESEFSSLRKQHAHLSGVVEHACDVSAARGFETLDELTSSQSHAFLQSGP